MKKEKIYLIAIILLVTINIVGFAMFFAYTQRIKFPISEIIVSKEGFIFKNEKGKVIAKISNGENGGVFEIFDKQEKIATQISEEKEEGGLITIYDNKGVIVARLLSSRVGGMLNIYNNERESVADLFASIDGGQLYISNDEGILKVSLPERPYGK
jgi:hypothetical protein